MALIDNIELPENIGEGSEGGPAYSTTIVRSFIGDEQRNQNWQDGLQKWQITTALQQQTDFQPFFDFYSARQGRLNGFLIKDPADYAATAQLIGIGDGATTQFQLVRHYVSDVVEDRPITRPIPGTINIYINGALQSTGVSVSTTTGVVTFTIAPAAGSVITADFDFYVPTRFDVDTMTTEWEWTAGNWQQVKVLEVREASLPVIAEAADYYGGLASGAWSGLRGVNNTIASAGTAAPGSQITADGTGIGVGTSDSFAVQYNYPWPSAAATAGAVIARVLTCDTTYSGHGAGIVMRPDDSNAGDLLVGIKWTAAGVLFFYRTAQNAAAQTIALPVYALPLWMKIVRSGPSFYGYISTDGTAWTPAGRVTLPSSFTNTAMGVFYHSGVIGSAKVGTFDSFAYGEPTTGQFPTDLTAQTGGPSFDTLLVPVASGYEERVGRWQSERLRWECYCDGMSPAMLAKVISFFRSHKGRAWPFRFKDWTDYVVTLEPAAQLTTTTFQITHSHASGARTVTRSVNRPVYNTVQVYNGSSPVLAGWTVDYTTGIITFTSAPGYTPNVSCQFDVLCRFDSDDLRVIRVGMAESSLQQLAIIEVTG